jgi:hypothetical protein
VTSGFGSCRYSPACCTSGKSASATCSRQSNSGLLKTWKTRQTGAQAPAAAAPAATACRGSALEAAQGTPAGSAPNAASAHCRHPRRSGCGTAASVRAPGQARRDGSPRRLAQLLLRHCFRSSGSTSLCSGSTRHCSGSALSKRGHLRYHASRLCLYLPHSVPQRVHLQIHRRQVHWSAPTSSCVRNNRCGVTQSRRR